MFRRYAAANSGLMRFYNLTYSTMRKIIDIYDIHQSNPAHLLDRSVDVARDFIRGINTYGDASTLIDTVYPGFLSGLFSEYPGLSKDERYPPASDIPPAHCAPSSTSARPTSARARPGSPVKWASTAASQSTSAAAWPPGESGNCVRTNGDVTFKMWNHIGCMCLYKSSLTLESRAVPRDFIFILPELFHIIFAA